MTEADYKIDEFMDLYKRVEERLKERGIKNGRSSIVMQFISSTEGRQFKDSLNTCREMRNILSHNLDINDEPPFVPSDSAIKSLRSVLDYLERPPLAIDHAVSGGSLVCAKLSDRVKPIMEKMVGRGFSHIPVFENGVLVGVFSISTVFSKALDMEEATVDNNTKISDFSAYLPIDNHVCESFIFAPRDTTIIEAEKLLENVSGPLHKRPAVLFITQNGSPDERILGMLTPWDVLGE